MNTVIKSGIKIARKNANFSLQELANILKVDVSTLEGWEVGAGTIPLPTLKKMSSILNVSIEFLIFADDREPLVIENLTKEQ